MPEKKKTSVIKRLRNYFITGAVVLIPIAITLYLTLFIIKISTKVLPKELNPNNYLPVDIPGLEIFISVFIITLIGFISVSFLGKKIIEFINNLLKRIPILRTIYSAIRQMTQSLTSSDNTGKSVVLIEYPRKEVWVIGFATKENKGIISKTLKQELINIFVPTTPNPTSGFLLMFPVDEVIYLNMTFEEASKFIVSAGTSNPKS